MDKNPLKQTERRPWYSIRWWVELPAIVMFALVLLGLFFPPMGGPNNSRKSVAKSDVVMIKSAIVAHGREYNTSLPATHAEIMKVLLGDNPRKITFLDVGEYRKGKGGLRNGIFLDPWGNPYRIDLSDPMHPKVSSLGKDKKGGTTAVQSWN
ncbi:MAG: hypothetical protein ABI615_04030 [Chthoniobacterales bacterium]